MNRKEFLKSIGFSTLGIAVLTASKGFSQTELQTDSTSIKKPSKLPEKIDFTIDLRQTQYEPLSHPGGSIYENEILIARIDLSNFAAISQICPHKGFTIRYEEDSKSFHCNKHDSNFNLDGSYISGPAKKAVKSYQTSITEVYLLRIFEL